MTSSKQRRPGRSREAGRRHQRRRDRSPVLRRGPAGRGARRSRAGVLRPGHPAARPDQGRAGGQAALVHRRGRRGGRASGRRRGGCGTEAPIGGHRGGRAAERTDLARQTWDVEALADAGTLAVVVSLLGGASSLDHRRRARGATRHSYLIPGVGSQSADSGGNVYQGRRPLCEVPHRRAVTRPAGTPSSRVRPQERDRP